MTRCSIYDDSMERLFALAEDLDTTLPEAIDWLLQYEEELRRENAVYIENVKQRKNSTRRV